MLLPPSAFLLIGGFIWISRICRPGLVEEPPFKIAPNSRPDEYGADDGETSHA